MNVMKSLRTRIFVTLALVLAVAGLAAGSLVYRWTFEEAIELQDALLIEIASIVETAPLTERGPRLGHVDADAQVVVEELGNEPARTSDRSKLENLADGLQTVARNGQAWRLFIRTRSDGSRFAVGQQTRARDQIANGSALRTVLPLAALIPFLMLLVRLVIRQSFRPMAHLADQLDRRQPEHVEGLPLAGMPTELHPFITSINRLLERIRVMIDQRRRFIAEAAHELRSPVTALSVQAENLNHADLPPESRGRLAALQEGIRRTGHLLEQLLSLARYDAYVTQDAPIASLDECAKDVVSRLMPSATERGIDLGFTRIEPLLVRGEPIMLTTMLRNLIDNAVGYTPAGGRIDISLSRSGNEAILLVEDTGPGIPEPDMKRIFEPFFRANQPSDTGTGLGLSIVKRIVERLDGSILLENVTSGTRSGLRAIVQLPASD
jgi:two-component system OmpR family sensor kinase